MLFLNSPERPVKLLLWAPVGGDVDGEQELGEVDVAVLVRVEGAEDVLAELGGVARGEELGVDLDERWLAQLSRGAVGYEAVVPFLQDRVFLQFEAFLVFEASSANSYRRKIFCSIPTFMTDSL